MKTKRVLVTGASGFVGHPLVAALLTAGYAVRAVTRSQTFFPDSVDVVTIPDLKNSFDWTPILQGADIIVHLAGPAHSKIPENAYSEFDQVNWIATQRLADAAKEARIEHFIYISSVRAQIGASAVQVVREQDEPRPTNQYGRSKLAGEQAIRASGVPFTIFRPVVIYGPEPKGNMQTVVQFARSRIPLPIGNLTSRRSLLGVENLISAIIFALNNPVTIGETYLVADSEPMTIREVLTTLCRVQGRSLSTIYVPQVVMRLLLKICGRDDLWSRLSGNLVVDTSKLVSAGWKPAIDTQAGLFEMMRSEDHKP
ncbi:MAG TPA: NAD-dependent epimerase/dehydratase family protein [Pseudolabrys sp.]